jgi:hypothetical protein
MRRSLPRLFVGFIILFPVLYHSQGCCSGGSGSPIAGGASQGVLQENQAEAAMNYQYLSTNRFFTADRDTAALFDRLSSNYLYGRLAFGVTDKLTLSLETGYFLDKTQYSHKRKDTIRSSGIADVIIFPRYSVFVRNTELTKTEVTLGLGMKLPVGSYNDSTVVYRHPVTGKKYYTTSPPTIQPTNGSQDFIFYAFFFRGYTEKKFRVFSNLIYIRKGWNPLGQKFGDYYSVGLFAGQTVMKKVNLTLQLRGEIVSRMQFDKSVDMLALYNIDVNSTGGRKMFISPQLGYSTKGWTFYALYEFPVYQYLNGTQVGSLHQLTAGLAYRFFVRSAD